MNDHVLLPFRQLIATHLVVLTESIARQLRLPASSRPKIGICSYRV